MDRLVVRTLTLICLLLAGLSPAGLALAQGGMARDAGPKSGGDGRLARVVEANIIATHAHQVLLARRSMKGDAACYDAGRLSDEELQSLVARQASRVAQES